MHPPLRHYGLGQNTQDWTIELMRARLYTCMRVCIFQSFPFPFSIFSFFFSAWGCHQFSLSVNNLFTCIIFVCPIFIRPLAFFLLKLAWVERVQCDWQMRFGPSKPLYTALRLLHTPAPLPHAYSLSLHGSALKTVSTRNRASENRLWNYSKKL